MDDALELTPSHGLRFNLRLRGRLYTYDPANEVNIKASALKDFFELYPKSWKNDYENVIRESIEKEVPVKEVIVKRGPEHAKTLSAESYGVPSAAYFVDAPAYVEVKLDTPRPVIRVFPDSRIIGDAYTFTSDPESIRVAMGWAIVKYVEACQAWREKMKERYAHSPTDTFVYAQNCSDFPVPTMAAIGYSEVFTGQYGFWPGPNGLAFWPGGKSGQTMPIMAKGPPNQWSVQYIHTRPHVWLMPNDTSPREGSSGKNRAPG